jgi:hypothetical protein
MLARVAQEMVGVAAGQMTMNTAPCWLLRNKSCQRSGEMAAVIGYAHLFLKDTTGIEDALWHTV